LDDRKEPKLTVSYWELFRFATRTEKLLVLVGVLCVCISSLMMPCGIILYGEFTTILVDREVRVGTSTSTNILTLFGGGRVVTNATFQESYEETMRDSRAFGIGCFCVSLIQLIFAALSIDILNRNAQIQISRIRKLFLQAVLRQDMTWYDLNTSDSFAVRMTE
jgi:ATP-binding cassette, subfamily B (MDR/TAP), member 1